MLTKIRQRAATRSLGGGRMKMEKWSKESEEKGKYIEGEKRWGGKTRM